MADDRMAKIAKTPRCPSGGRQNASEKAENRRHKTVNKKVFITLRRRFKMVFVRRVV